MKNLLILILLSSASLCLSQSEWAPIGATWYYDYYAQFATGYVKIESIKDTVVDTKQCKYLYITETVYEYPDVIKSYNIDSLITYQDNSKIYLYTKGNFVQLYDFNPTVGDVWETSEIPNFFNYSPSWHDPTDTTSCPAGKVVVDSVKTMFINNQSLKAIYTSPYNFSKKYYYGVILEGIGCLDYMLPNDLCYPIVDIPRPDNLRCYNSPSFSHSWSNKTCDYLPETNEKKWAPIGAVWHYGVVESPCIATNEGYYKYESIKDTIIQTKVCSVIKKTNTESTGNIKEMGFEYTYFENGIVYQLIKNKFYPLYNFNAQVGDTWTTHLPADIKGYPYPEDSLITIHVDSIKSISNSGILLKELYVSSLSSKHGYIDWTFKNPIIEKIGANYMFLGEWGLWDIDIPYLRCYNDNAINYQVNSIIGCESIINSVNVPIANGFRILPNPSSNFIQLDLDYSTESTHVITIYNIIGECVLKQKINNKTDNILIDISNLKSGIYFINLDLNKIQAKKLIKQ